jgi:hypothetical protein
MVKWARDGGVLYLIAGRSAWGEFDNPPGLDNALTVRREPLDFQENQSHERRSDTT